MRWYAFTVCITEVARQPKPDSTIAPVYGYLAHIPSPLQIALHISSCIGKKGNVECNAPQILMQAMKYNAKMHDSKRATVSDQSSFLKPKQNEEMRTMLCKASQPNADAQQCVHFLSHACGHAQVPSAPIPCVHCMWCFTLSPPAKYLILQHMSTSINPKCKPLQLKAVNP